MIRSGWMLPLALAWAAPALAGPITMADATQAAPDRLAIVWSDPDPVDLYVSDKPDAVIAAAHQVAAGNRDGHYDLKVLPGAHVYVLIRDRSGGGMVRVADRLVPLQQGSNFRDIGGYAAAGGKHVRWGLIYRSGATPMLTDADVAAVKSLGIKDLIDLRSSEERASAPTRINGIRYAAVGYPMAQLIPDMKGAASSQGMSGIYRKFPTLLAPQLRIVFDRLLAKEGPIAYNCSAGQDRTGFTTALILTVLGVPRDTIYADYHLSTAYRHPEFERPSTVSPAEAGNPVAAAAAQQAAARKPQPLYDTDHKPFLAIAFDEVEKQWGSVDAYLEKEVGVTAADRTKLRALYLE